MIKFRHKTVITVLIILILTACSGITGDDKKNINKYPIAHASASPAMGLKSTTYSFSSEGSNDPDGTIVSYEWREGATVLSKENTFQKNNFTIGSHTVVLTVTDDKGAQTHTSTGVLVQSESFANMEIKKTGQSKSFDTNGNEVQDGSIKDDGFYQKGVQDHYERDATKEVVIDHVTGLIWQDDAEAKTVTKPWLTQENSTKCKLEDNVSACYDKRGDTAASYCENLALGGYTDWRLPTIKELITIVDFGKHEPCIDTRFFHNIEYYADNNARGQYWSDTIIDDTGVATASFETCDIEGRSIEDSPFHVRCVRVSQ